MPPNDPVPPVMSILFILININLIIPFCIFYNKPTSLIVSLSLLYFAPKKRILILIKTILRHLI